MNVSRLSKSRFGIIILVVLFVGGLFRFLGVNPGFNQFHSDEGISYSAAVSMLRNSNFDPLRYDYPALVPEVNWLTFRFIFTPIYWTKYYITNINQMIDGYLPYIPKEVDMNRIFQNDILGNREINALFWGRYTTAFVSTASIFALYLLALRMFNRKVALLSAIFLAFHFRSVTNSHLGLPDTYNAFFLLFSLIASWSIQKYPTKGSYILAGVAVGLSLATKYQVFAILPFIFSHLLRYWNPQNPRSFFTIFKDFKIVIAGLSALFIFIILNPYLIINFDFATYSIHEVSLKYAMGKSVISLFPLHYWIFNDFGLVLVGVIFAGILFSVYRRSSQALFLLAHVVPFLFVMLYYSNGGFYVRNFITVSPLFLLFAALLVVEIYTFLRRFNLLFASFAIAALISLLVYMPITNILIHTREYQKPWNYKTIVEDVRSVLPKNAVVVGHPFDPLPSELEPKRISISTANLYSLQEFRKMKADFALINMDWAADPFYGWMTSAGGESLSYVLHKPYDQMRETYWGLSIEEMMHYAVTGRYKPWQAPEANLFLIAVPKFTSYTFSSPDQVPLDTKWRKMNQSDAPDTFLLIRENNTLALGPGSGKFGIARFVSPEMPVEPGVVYRLSAQLESEKDFANATPNVFIRVDFYNKEQGKILTSVSDRFVGKKGSIEVLTQVPPDAQYLTISYQATNALAGSVMLSSVSMAKAKAKEPFPQQFVSFSDYQDLLYPNSHGNL